MPVDEIMSARSALADAYRLMMQEKLAELQENLDEIYTLLAEGEAVNALVYRATERNLQLLVEACIGIAKQLLKSRGQQVPSDARRAFEKLRGLGLDKTDIPWNKVIGMRNALVHDYLNLDRERITAIIREKHYQQLILFAGDSLGL